MPRWVLNCPNCQQEFTHTQIERRSLQDYYLEPKPDFPREGMSVQCPHCNASSIYQRHQLTYRADQR
jgi:endogenous inhibitor of DNA gyrase (YacG/DUF329 family)